MVGLVRALMMEKVSEDLSSLRGLRNICPQNMSNILRSTIYVHKICLVSCLAEAQLE
eukprot:19799_5